MRVLLLSANTGEGHNSTAKAIIEVLAAQGISCCIEDTLACLSPRFSKFVCNWHVRLYRYGGKLFDVGYRVLERNTAEPDETTPVYELLALGAGKLKKIVESYDAVICVHAFSGVMMTEVRRVYGIQIPCYFVATDYTCSPTVELCDMDAYFIPDSSLAGEFVRVGLPRNRLVATGIPVRQAFYSREDQAAARQRLGLPLDDVLVLLMCGSMGAGPLRKVAKELTRQMPDNVTVVAVCGNNERLYEAMSELDDPRLRVLGYTRDIPAYMDAVDMIVTKPGGLSATEAANKHLPMVFLNAVGGCEGRNFEFFLSRGLAEGSTEPEEVVKFAAELALDGEARQKMRQALAAQFTVNSARKIAQYVLGENP